MRDVGLAVLAEVLAVGVDDGGGVVVDAGRLVVLFVHRHDQHHARSAWRGPASAWWSGRRGCARCSCSTAGPAPGRSRARRTAPGRASPGRPASRPRGRSPRASGSSIPCRRSRSPGAARRERCGACSTSVTVSARESSARAQRRCAPASRRAFRLRVSRPLVGHVGRPRRGSSRRTRALPGSEISRRSRDRRPGPASGRFERRSDVVARASPAGRGCRADQRVAEVRGGAGRADGLWPARNDRPAVQAARRALQGLRVDQLAARLREPQPLVDPDRARRVVGVDVEARRARSPPRASPRSSARAAPSRRPGRAGRAGLPPCRSRPFAARAACPGAPSRARSPRPPRTPSPRSTSSPRGTRASPHPRWRQRSTPTGSEPQWSRKASLWAARAGSSSAGSQSRATRPSGIARDLHGRVDRAVHHEERADVLEPLGVEQREPPDLPGERLDVDMARHVRRQARELRLVRGPPRPRTISVPMPRRR